MGRELSTTQTIFWSIFSLFILIRGAGVTWFLSLFSDEDSGFETFVNFISNDMYAFIISVSLLLIIVFLGRGGGISRRFINFIGGKKTDL